MTHTDRAFIAALQQADASGVRPRSAPMAPTPAPTRPTSVGVRTKAPLSRHLAQRRGAPSDSAARVAGRVAPTVEIDSLSWPAVVAQLAHAGRESLLRLLSEVAGRSSRACPIIAVVGARKGVGATTLALALARVSGGLGAATAVVDLCERDGAAPQLGVRRGDSERSPAPAVASREDHTLVVVAAGLPEVAPLLETLAQRCELIVIDAGAPTDAAGWLAGAESLEPLVVLVDAAPSDAHAVADALAVLPAACVAGVVETFAPTT